MNNEIGRKLTSLTLMTIMLAGGMVIGAPSMVPEAAAAGQLFVSAENANFNNYFAGAQIVEIIVKDPKATEVDEKQQEPTVKVNEFPIRLAQGADGYWYAYIAETAEVVLATANANLDYGTQAAASNITFNSNITPYHTSAVIGGAPTLSLVDKDGGDDDTTQHGQIGVATGEWPFIQALDFTIETFEIKLEQAGTDEIVVLKHDNDDIDDFSSVVLDRNTAPLGAQVHLTVTDQALNIDPTTEDVIAFKVTAGSEGVSFKAGTTTSDGTDNTINNSGQDNLYVAFSNGFDDNGKLKITYNTNGTAVIANDATLDDVHADEFLIFFETAENSGIFVNTDDDDDSNLQTLTGTTLRGLTATFDYNDSAQSLVIGHDFATIDMDATSVGDEWNSGEEMTIVLYDQDLNLNTFKDEDLTVQGGTLVPSIQIGTPLSLTSTAKLDTTTIDSLDSFSKIARSNDLAEGTANIIVDTGISIPDMYDLVDESDAEVFEFISYNIKSLLTTTGSISDVHITSSDDVAVHLTAALASVEEQDILELNFIDSISTTFTDAGSDGFTAVGEIPATALDALSAGDVTIAQGTGSSRTTIEAIVGADGTLDSITRSNPTFVNGAVTAYQGHGNVLVTFVATTGAQSTVSTELAFVVDFFSFGDQVNNAIYRIELEETGENTATFEGSAEYVMLNQTNYHLPATYSAVNPTQDDVDMIVHLDMTDEDSIRVNYLDLGADGVSTQIADQEAAPTHSGTADLDLDSYKIADTVVVTITDQDLNTNSELIDVYITNDDDTNGDKVGLSTSAAAGHIADITFDDATWQDLSETGFNLLETGTDSGVFMGSFQVPTTFNGGLAATGTDIEVNYNDHRDSSGNTIEVGDGASIRANTGSVTFDRTVYPVPWDSDDFSEHSSASGSSDLAAGSVAVHISVEDADADQSAFGQDSISSSVLSVKVTRGSIASANLASTTATILETSPTSGIFEYDLTIASADISGSGTFASGAIVQQGDIITVTYTDSQDASGKSQTVTDSSSFDLRNGTLQADKSVYLIGSDMILTLIEPDFDLDNDETESYTLNLIEWDSDAAETVLGSGGGVTNAAAFDPEPSAFRETGDSTGIFQVVIEIPDTLDGNLLDRGEKIDLEYTDWGPAGADYVGQEDEDIGLTVYTSNFGATIELDQKVYTWTDKVYITIVAPDHNFDSGLVDEIGNTSNDPIKVSTRGSSLNTYKLVESGPDTGIFIGEVTLTGFLHDADGVAGNDTVPTTSADGSGPTNGQLKTSDNDGLTVSFEFSEDETVVGSALIRWNIGEVQWLEASYPASGTGVVRVIDADMNLNPEQVDNFTVDAWSDSDAGGIDLTVTETNEATGIFEGTVFFTVANDSSGHRLRVAEGDTVTAEYEDNTLPEPYTTADELDIAATTLIGTIVPPLERAPAANLRTVDAFGNSLNSVSVDQQVQISADLANGQDKEQSFAYLVQVQDGDGVTVSLAWITGSLSSGQSFSPALSWIPTESGSYTATAFVWESVDNPTALSPPVSTTITVQ